MTVYKTSTDLEGVSAAEFFSEISEAFQKSADIFYAATAETLKKLHEQNDVNFNGVVENLFKNQSDVYGGDIKKFIQFLIDGIEEYISFSQNTTSSPEQEKRQKQNWDFEWKYHAILYYGQPDPIKIMPQIPDKTPPLGQKIKGIIASILTKK